MTEREPELIDYLAVLWRWRWLVVGGTLAAVLLGGFLTWLVPRTYRLQAAVDVGDLGGASTKEIERLVASVNMDRPLAGDGAETGRPTRVTAVYRAPFLVELHADTRVPAAAKTALERAATWLVDELGRIHSLEKERRNDKLAGAERRLDLLRREATGLVGQIRATVTRRLADARAGLDLARSMVRRLETTQGLAERRLEVLRQLLGELREARARALGDASSATTALVVSQLSDEILGKEEAVALNERWLATELPAALQHARTEERILGDELRAWEQARKAVESAESAGEGSMLGAVRAALYLAPTPSPGGTARFAETLQRLATELPDRILTLEHQIGEMRRESARDRVARMVTSPQVPGSPIAPRRTLNLAVSLVAGLMGSILVAFLVDYVGRAGARSRVG